MAWGDQVDVRRIGTTDGDVTDDKVAAYLANRQNDGGWALYHPRPSPAGAPSANPARSNPRGRPFKPRRASPPTEWWDR